MSLIRVAPRPAERVLPRAAQICGIFVAPFLYAAGIRRRGKADGAEIIDILLALGDVDRDPRAHQLVRGTLLRPARAGPRAPGPGPRRVGRFLGRALQPAGCAVPAARRKATLAALSEPKSTAARLRLGAASLSTPSHLPPIVGSKF